MPQVFDLSAPKRVESLRNPELPLRLCILLVGALTIFWTKGDVVILIYLACYYATFAVFGAWIALAPTRISLRHMLYLSAYGCVPVFVLLGACLYLFSQPSATLSYVGLILYMGTGLNIVVIRARVPHFYVVDVIIFYVGALGFLAVEYQRSSFSSDLALVGMAIGGVCAYVATAMHDLNSLRQRVEDDQVEQLSAQYERTIGQLTGGVAHEFNNILAVILGNLELARETVSDRERGELLSEAEVAAHRGARLTQRLLTLSHKAPLQPRRVNMATVLGALASVAAPILGQSHRLHIADVEGVPDVYVDEGTLTLVLLNVIMNARDAMKQGGTIWLGAKAEMKNGEPFVCVGVNDTGTGMDAEVLDHVFEPFFSTKPVGQGSGLGLPMAKGFVEQSGGHVVIHSEVDDGTEVKLYLPMAQPDRD